jgi:hypothetical protein
MRTLILVTFLAVPLQAHDFWIEPSTFRPARGEAVTASLRVGEHFAGGRLEREGIEFHDGLVAYRSANFATVTLPLDKFKRYLQEEGLTHINPSPGLQRERYKRFAKAVLGDARPGPLGWRFELVPLAGSRFQLLHEGRPLPGALVVALNRAQKRLEARTDANGIVTFDLARGAWLVKSVHMIHAPAGSGMQWESLWASLTLER